MRKVALEFSVANLISFQISSAKLNIFEPINDEL